MDNQHRDNLFNSEDISLLKQAGKEALRAILSEDARVQALPIVQKAGVICDLIISFSESFGDGEIELQYKNILEDAGFELCNKLVIAENSLYFNDKMENALLVKIAAKKIINQLAGMEVLGISNPDYCNLIKDEMEKFRALYNKWVSEFENKVTLSDGWDLPLNS
jgi:hypothetical protein